MRLRVEARVGLVVLLALIALGVVYWFFGGLGLRSGTYPLKAVFNDVLRLSRGAEVRMAGVLVGKVDDFELTPDKQALVLMRISRRYKDAIPSDSTARVTTGGLTGVGDYYVEIVPGSSSTPVQPGKYLRTARMPRVDDLLVQVKDIVTGAQKSLGSIQDILQSPKTRQSLENIIANVDDTTKSAAGLVEDVRKLLASNKPELERTLDRALAGVEDFAAAGKDIRSALERGGVNRVDELLTRAEGAAKNLEAATQRLRELAEDKTIETQLRETIASAHEAAKGAAEIVGRLQRVLGPRERQRAGTPAAAIPGGGSRLDAFVKTDTGDFRVDYNLTIPGRRNDFYRIGAFDLGENTKLNLQVGQMLGDRSAFRYGFYASRIGVGYDRRLADNLDLQLDLYRLNDPRLEGKLRYGLSRDWGAWIGVEDVFGEGGALLGLQYRR